jgi:hypothetical protein
MDRNYRVGTGALVKPLLPAIWSVIGFGVEGGQTGMVQAVAADKVDYKKHQE